MMGSDPRAFARKLVMALCFWVIVVAVSVAGYDIWHTRTTIPRCVQAWSQAPL